MSGTPAAEVAIDEALVRALLRDQHPDLAELPVTPMDGGWDNAMYRLGADYTIRMPRRNLAVALLHNEQDWLPVIAADLPLPVPSPLRTGAPGHGYPWKWSILPWLAGETASEQPPLADQARVLGNFLRALHQPAPANAPLNAFRGCPLADRTDGVTIRFNQLQDLGVNIEPKIRTAWNAGVAAPVARSACWLHGDLHARNVLVDRGRISAIIDWGDITAGDVATDLASVWALFDAPSARRDALNTYGADAAEIARAQGWAVYFGAVLLATGLIDNPRHARMGADTLRRVAADVVMGC